MENNVQLESRKDLAEHVANLFRFSQTKLSKLQTVFDGALSQDSLLQVMSICEFHVSACVSVRRSNFCFLFFNVSVVRVLIFSGVFFSNTPFYTMWIQR
jgi:hypothetical protein